MDLVHANIPAFMQEYDMTSRLKVDLSYSSNHFVDVHTGELDEVDKDYRCASPSIVRRKVAVKEMCTATRHSLEVIVIWSVFFAHFSSHFHRLMLRKYKSK